MSLEISVGQPQADGRYVAFVRCKGVGVADFCEPIIATWHGERWHETREIFGWTGPIPVVKVVWLKNLCQQAQEYDL